MKTVKRETTTSHYSPPLTQREFPSRVNGINQQTHKGTMQNPVKRGTNVTKG